MRTLPVDQDRRGMTSKPARTSSAMSPSVRLEKHHWTRCTHDTTQQIVYRGDYLRAPRMIVLAWPRNCSNASAVLKSCTSTYTARPTTFPQQSNFCKYE